MLLDRGWVGLLVLFASGLLYRATFLNQGIAGTDEGFFQSLAARVLRGQLPYRDFNLFIGPLSVYKEAALLRLLGPAYGILAERWVFALEATAGSLLAYAIVARFAGSRRALLATLPTVFFSVILYYFSNYTYDGAVLVLVAVALLVMADRRPLLWAFLAGLAAGLAFLAKPNFLAFVPLVPLAGIVRRVGRAGAWPAGFSLPAIERGWPAFLGGFALVVIAFFVAFGPLVGVSTILNQWFVLRGQTHPVTPGFLIWQDLPDYLTYRRDSLPIAAALLAALLIPVPKGHLLRPAAASLVAIVSLSRFWAYPHPLPPRPSFMAAGLVVLSMMTLASLLVTLLVRLPALAGTEPARGLRAQLFPPELPLFALALQYTSQYSYSGADFYYIGSYLAIPVALLTLAALRPTVSRRLRGYRAGAAVLGAWLAAGSFLTVRFYVYEDGDRAQLTAGLHSSRLQGVQTLPNKAHTIDGMVDAVERYSRPGDPVLVFPDYPGLYYLTGRRNPTRVEWYNVGVLTPAIAQESVAELERDPPVLVLLEIHHAYDYDQSRSALDYRSVPAWRPVYDYIQERYREVATVGDVIVLLPRVSAARRPAEGD